MPDRACFLRNPSTIATKSSAELRYYDFLLAEGAGTGADGAELDSMDIRLQASELLASRKAPLAYHLGME